MRWVFPPFPGKAGKGLLTLKSSVESLTQRRREAESAEKVQKSDGKENHDKNSLGKFSHPIGENEYILKQWDNLCELRALCASA
jgi:hypothetical protein